MKRIFIAIKPEPGEKLSDIVSSLKSGLINEGIKWTSIDNIHITLAFLGDTDEKTIRKISSKLKESCEKSGNFEIIISGLGLFKNSRDPRVIWTGIEPSEELTKLYNTIFNGLNESGVNMEKRPFRPHLTLGRIKHLKDQSVLKNLMDEYQKSEIQKVAVNEIIIYESILKPTGPFYKPITIIRL
jgi:2'-5' RNA ligase